MNKLMSRAGMAILAALVAVPVQATILSVGGGTLSSVGIGPSLIAAPTDALDDVVTNFSMEGFDEAQGVVTSVAHATDGGVIPAGTLVDSHMIFLNSSGTTFISHFGVDWVFDGPIIGIMSDSGGTLEAASTFELGAPATNYTVTFMGSGPAAPFPARGLEGNAGGTGGADGYMLVNPFTLRVDMEVTEPGDWIRVITTPVPEPGTVLLMSLGLLGLGFAGARRLRA